MQVPLRHRLSFSLLHVSSDWHAPPRKKALVSVVAEEVWVGAGVQVVVELVVVAAVVAIVVVVGVVGVVGVAVEVVVAVMVVVVAVVAVRSFEVVSIRVVEVSASVKGTAVVESGLFGVVDENSAVVKRNVSPAVNMVCRRVREIPETYKSPEVIFGALEDAFVLPEVSNSVVKTSSAVVTKRFVNRSSGELAKVLGSVSAVETLPDSVSELEENVSGSLLGCVPLSSFVTRETDS